MSVSEVISASGTETHSMSSENPGSLPGVVDWASQDPTRKVAGWEARWLCQPSAGAPVPAATGRGRRPGCSL